MRPLAEALAVRGFAVRAPRLRGHGTDVADLAATRWTDWYASAEAELAAFPSDVSRIAVVGLSMGGLLALRLAAAHRTRVTAVAVLSTPIRIGDPRARLLPAVARLGPLWRWLDRRVGPIPKPNGPDITDAAIRAESPSYLATPLSAVVELMRLQAVVRRALAGIAQPVLLLHGRRDRSVPLVNLDMLRRHLGGRVVGAHVLERSGHVVTVDVERETVAGLVGDFLEDR
jgi:carboxylesterase